MADAVQVPNMEGALQLYNVHLLQLTEHQKCYYHTLTAACIGPDQIKLCAGLQNLSVGPNISVYMPALNYFIHGGLVESLQLLNLDLLKRYIRMLKAILTNKGVDLSQYILKLMPLLRRCIIAERVSLHPESDNHWDMRDLAAETLAKITNEYVYVHQDLAQICLQEFAPIIWNADTLNLPSIYGALVGIGNLGPMHVRDHVIPHIKKKLSPRIEMLLENKDIACIDFIGAMYIKISVRTYVAPLLRAIKDPPHYMHVYKFHFGYLGIELYKRVCQLM